jgi:hypothetical protein
MKPSMSDIVFAGIVALFIVLVDGGVVLVLLSVSVRDAFLQRILQDIGAAAIAASPFIFLYQLFGWADAQERSTHATQART